jgi:hypothetical protein
MPHRDGTNRPDCESAHSFSAAFCDDPGCGLHLIAYRHTDQPICQIVVSREAVRGLLAMIHEAGLDL